MSHNNPVTRAVIVFIIITLLVIPNALALDTNAAGAILLEAGTGRVLFEKNADEPMLIASTTKIMTCLLAVEGRSPDEAVTIPGEAVGVEGSSMYLREGQQMPLGELLNGLMLRSGNDAAVAVAIHLSGSAERFVERMNERAAELGMENTVFCNPHGLWDENYSTARDMARLTAAAMENERFRGCVSQKTAPAGETTVKNHNKLLWSVEGCEGVKTGYTQKAGRCLVSSARRGDSRFIAVTLRDGNDWADHTAMLDYAFAEYPVRVLWKAGQVYTVPVLGGLSPRVNLMTRGELALPLSDEELEDIELRIERPPYLWANVVGGTAYGRVLVYRQGVLLAETPLIAETAVTAEKPAKRSWLGRILLPEL